MPEQKKRGFHALEERIHQIEEDDAKAGREAAGKPESQSRTAPPAQRPPETPKR